MHVVRDNVIAYHCKARSSDWWADVLAKSEVKFLFVVVFPLGFWV